MRIIDRATRHELTKQEILDEVNRDRNEEWRDYIMEDFDIMPEDILGWIDSQYFEVIK
jgi:hypothetical protein